MYTLPFSELMSWVVALPPAELANGGTQFPRNRGVGAGKQDNHYTAMHAAMRYMAYRLLFPSKFLSTFNSDVCAERVCMGEVTALEYWWGCPAGPQQRMQQPTM